MSALDTREGKPAAGFPFSKNAGISTVEIVVVLAIVAVTVSLAGPRTVDAMDAGRGWQAAAFVAARVQMARQQAVLHSVAVGLVFDLVAARWTFRVCQDGNRNGLRRADIAAGRDPCPDGPYDLAILFPGVLIAVDPSLRGPDDEPGSPDPVRLGASDLASFSAAGTGSAGSVFLRAPNGDQFIVRVASAGRVRTLRFDRPSASWIAP